MNNREIDFKIGIKVMGWKYKPYGNGGGEWKNKDGEKVAFGPSPGNYSEDISKAWPIADKFNFSVNPHWKAGLGDIPRDGWAVYGDAESAMLDTQEMPGDERALAVAETAPMAICLAALKKVGVKV